MWNTVKLGDVCELATGGTPSRKEKEYFENGNIKWLVSGDINQREIYDCEGRITNEGLLNSNAKYLPENSVLIALNGQGKTRGTVALLRTQATCNQSLVSINPKTDVALDTKFLFYVLDGMYEKIRTMTGDSGNDRRGLNMPLIRGIEIPLPPLAEQQRIVAKLDAAFAEVDRAMEVVAEKEKQSGQLADTALDQIADLDGEIVTLAEVCSIDATLVSPTEEPYLHQKHIGAGNIISFSNELVDILTAEEEKLTSGKYPFNTTSVLYSKIRPYLRKVHLPEFVGICSADMYPLVPAKEKLTREFLFYLLLSSQFTNYAITGSARAGMPKVNRNHLFAYKFALPTYSSQRAFSEKMEDILSQTRCLKSLYQRQINALTSLKSAILHQELQPPKSEAA